MPTDESLSNESNRRAFLKTAGAATATANATLSGCVGGFTGSSGGGSLADASPADEITFIAEDLAATAGFRNFTSQFEEEFRIGVTVDLAPYSEMVEQINQQFAAGSGEYAAIYSDPYANVAAFPDKHVNLDQFIGNDEFESVPNGVRDFVETHLATDAVFAMGEATSSATGGGARQDAPVRREHADDGLPDGRL